ncbi:unnamed protein product [Adineta ricciae]|uniref:BED-type domain-containing protein n=1 Tax=Adineta ricciae TaxID=249248 RepID=A0A815MZX1_ADIRI|nr:unnamed protein product [Adineta ricciae]
MAPKRAKRVVNVTTNSNDNNHLSFQTQVAGSGYQSKSFTTNQSSTQGIAGLTTGAEGGEDENQENRSDSQLQSVNKRHSDVWEYMKKHDNDKASCNRCGAVLSRKNGGTTGLRKHLHQMHKMNQFAASSVTKKSQGIRFPSEMKKKLDTLVVECVIEDGRSFDDLRRSGLLKIFKQVAPGYTPPHRQTVQKRLVRLYSEHKRRLINRLSTVSWIAMTCDFWSDKRLYSYLCITGHYITSNFEPKSEVLAFSSFEQRHYSTNIAHTLQEKLKELNILEKTTTITTDGAANMVKTFESFRSGIKRVGCIAHRLHLTVCNSLGLWMRKKKQPASSSITTAASTIAALDPDDSDEEDYTDDGCLSPTVLFNKNIVRSSDDSQLSMDVDDDAMSVGSNDEDQLVIDDDIVEDEFDDSCADLVDNWSQDVVVEFDPSTCVAEQTSIGLLMKKCRTFVKLVNKSSILKGYVDKLKKEFKVKRSLQMDCKSRWSSTHYLLQTMTTYKKLINRLYSEKHDIGLNDKQVKKLISIELDKLDWTTIEAIERVLHPFAKATKLVSGKQYPTIGISYFAISQIREYLEDEQSSDSSDPDILSRLKQLLIFYMEKYFEKDVDQWNLLKKHAYFDPVGFGVLQRAERRAIERELTELYEKVASEAVDNTENEMDGPLSSNNTSTYIPRDSKRSRMIDFLDSMDRKKVASLPVRRSNSRNSLGEELSIYRSLAQKRYNEVVEGVDDGDAVSSRQSVVIPLLTDRLYAV